MKLKKALSYKQLLCHRDRIQSVEPTKIIDYRPQRCILKRLKSWFRNNILTKNDLIQGNAAAVGSSDLPTEIIRIKCQRVKRKISEILVKLLIVLNELQVEYKNDLSMIIFSKALLT